MVCLILESNIGQKYIRKWSPIMGGSCLEPITIYALQGQWTILVQRSDASDLPLNLRFGIGFENTKPVDFLQHMCLSEWDRLHTVVCWWLAPYGARQGHALPAFEWIAVVFYFRQHHGIQASNISHFLAIFSVLTQLFYQGALHRTSFNQIWHQVNPRLLWLWNLYVGTKEWH